VHYITVAQHLILAREPPPRPVAENCAGQECRFRSARRVL